jgi:hypothetical protein
MHTRSHREFKQQAVKGGDKLDLGGGHVMEFVMAPNLHWPDTMFSYDHATGVCERVHWASVHCGRALCVCICKSLHRVRGWLEVQGGGGVGLMRRRRWWHKTLTTTQNALASLCRPGNHDMHIVQSLSLPPSYSTHSHRRDVHM